MTPDAIPKKKLFFIQLAIALIICVFTFPSLDWHISPGIDSSLTWIFNYAFTHFPSKLEHLHFPHGPLAFLQYPIPPNFTIGLFFNFMLKLVLIFQLFQLNTEQNTFYLGLNALLGYLLCVISPISHLVIINVLLLVINHHLRHKLLPLIIGIALASIAIYIRAFIGIVSIIILAGYWVFLLVVKKSYQQVALSLALLPLFICCIWWALSYDTESLPKYIYGILELGADNSSAAAFYPQNNWWALFGMFIGLFALMILNRDKLTLFYSFICVPLLFAAWKHGMAREEVSHVKGFYILEFAVLTIYLLLQKKRKIINTLITLATLWSFGYNLQEINLLDETINRLNFNRTSFLKTYLTDFDNHQIKKNIEAQEAWKTHLLPDTIRVEIGDDLVDIYPRDYTILAANKLNWQPRPILQSYASYTPWLDKQNAKHFASTIAPQWIVWKLEKGGPQFNQNQLNSIDFRYLLNDEPQTLRTILCYYDLKYQTENFVILKKRKTPLKIKLRTSKSRKIQFNEWIQVPKNPSSFTQASVNFNKSMLQKFKSFLYKDEQHWVYLKLENDEIHKFRIVPKNAYAGIWLAPYFLNFKYFTNIKEIMFTASNQKILNNSFAICFQHYTIDPPNKSILATPKKRYIDKEILFQQENNFEYQRENWSEYIPVLDSIESEHKSRHIVVAAKSYSPIFRKTLLNYPTTPIYVNTQCWLKSTSANTDSIALVIAIRDKWHPAGAKYQITDPSQWNHISNYLEYSVNSGDELRAYILNRSSKEIKVDNFSIKIISKDTLSY